MTKIHFTADTHFNHANIINYSLRPFKSLDAMTGTIIENWNAKVSPRDTVYHLGDFALSWGRRHAELIDDLLRRLNGHKHLIVGNHDREEVVKSKQWIAVKHYHELKIDLGGEHRQRIVLCHYAMRVWNQNHRGAWMLHGHSHGNLPDIGGKITDVGVDCWNYSPVSLDQIAEYMGNRDIVAVDHHST